MKTAWAAVCLLFVLATFAPTEQSDQADDELIGRPDGHEPYDRPLIGRPDGHDFPVEKDSSSSSESSDESGPEDDDVEDAEEEEEEPLVRCKRPMCAMYCEFGFKKDSTGCPICECLRAAESSLIGRPDGHEAASTRPPCRGPEPMCANYCPHGYRYNADGCMTCDCVVPAAEARSRPRCRGPMPMCANRCPGGYKYKPDGCMTCECVEDDCAGSGPCEEGLVCRNRTVNDVTKPMCTVKTLCEKQRDEPAALGSSPVTCEDDGTFKPMQCTTRQTECWCVDGLGREVPDTRTSVYIDQHKPKCVRNVTVSMHIHMVMVVEHHIDVTRLDSLHSLIIDHVSSWMLIEPHYVSVVKTEAQDSDDEEDEARLVIVELVVIHDGVTDLPSAGEHMKHCIDNERCRIPVKGGGSLKPAPRSMTVKHKFAASATTTAYPSAEPVLLGEGRGVAVLRLTFCAVAALILVTIIIAAACVGAKRKRYNLAAQFRHQKLESPVISKNFLTNDYVPELVSVDTKDVVKEKEPIA